MAIKRVWIEEGCISCDVSESNCPEDFKVKKTIKSKSTNIDSLKIKVRLVEQKDIEERNLPKNSKGLVITEIASDSPINYLNVNNIIIVPVNKIRHDKSIKIWYNKHVTDITNVFNSRFPLSVTAIQLILIKILNEY